MSMAVGVGLGPLELAAAGLEGTDVSGADVVGGVVFDPDEHPASATRRTAPIVSSLWCVFIPALLSIRPGSGVRPGQRERAGRALRTTEAWLSATLKRPDRRSGA